MGARFRSLWRKSGLSLTTIAKISKFDVNSSIFIFPHHEHVAELNITVVNLSGVAVNQSKCNLDKDVEDLVFT